MGDRKKQEETTSLLSVDVDMTGQRENHGNIVSHLTIEHPIIVAFLPSYRILPNLSYHLSFLNIPHNPFYIYFLFFLGLKDGKATYIVTEDEDRTFNQIFDAAFRLVNNVTARKALEKRAWLRYQESVKNVSELQRAMEFVVAYACHE